MTKPESQDAIAEVVGVTLDVIDLDLEIAFWGAALGQEILTEVEGWAVFELPNGLTLDLQQVPENKVAKNRFHFDLRIRSGDNGVQRLRKLGASVVEHIVKEVGEWYVMADPEGNEFCAIIRNTHFAAADEGAQTDA
ncbi:MAG: VOC family protein [Chloroflexi bacterium]|nr:VOC family protein [Chloroflexota bacterium]